MPHFYDNEGNPRHYVPIASGKNKGKLRDSTLRDAKKHKWHPSVSEYTSMLAKPFLIPWNGRRMLNAAFDSPPIGDEDKLGWVNSVVKRVDSDFERDVTQRGTELHQAIEDILNDRGVEAEIARHVWPVVEIVRERMAATGTTVTPELTFSNPANGYGGTIDCPYSDYWVDDFKSKDFKGKDEVEPSFEHCMQIASYQKAYHPEGLLIGGRNIYFDRQIPGLVFVHEWTPEELQRGWEAFQACQTLYRITKGYDSRA